MKDFITVKGREISYEIKDVDINKLEYYPENPRINFIISKYPKEEVTQKFIESELIKLEQTKERMKDLEDNKGLIDEIYVLKNKVIEGNTRLCAFRRLSQKYPDDKRWKTIKARVLQNDVSDEELFIILGIFHIRGKTPWVAFEKAAYIYRMTDILKKDLNEVAKQFNMSKNSVEALLKAYKVMMKKFLKKNASVEKQAEELKKFSYFDAFYRQKELVERINSTPQFENAFVEWVRDGRFKKAQNVRDLPKILNSKRAQNIFRTSEPEVAYEEAMQVLHKEKPGKVDKFYKEFEDFSIFIDQIEINKVKKEISETRSKKYVIESCYKKFKKFIKECGLEI